MDYREVGLLAGIEIHQQLDTAEKLFCRCPTTLRRTAEHSGEFYRYLRATESELGEVDQAAREEMMVERRFTYYPYDTTCLVENDEEPPAEMNPEAFRLSLVCAKMLSMTPIAQVHTMRKLVIDGSNTSGFQRTALVAVNGVLPGGGAIETLCLEEEACQRVAGDTFSLDRLGIPLVEITTSPCLHSPEEVQDTARYLGMILRSTGRVKRGIGTIRQDVNISVRGGARVEIKGVQELDLLAEVVRREVSRQLALLAIRDELKRRNAGVVETPVDVTAVFAGTTSAIIGRAKVVLATRLNGFAGLVGREIQPGRRLGSELSDYAKRCGVGGIFHTDELPAYGITSDEVDRLRDAAGASDSDCVVIVAADRKAAVCAAAQVVRRAKMACEGVPEETRRMLEEGSTAYMRPLPGAARMYPETDVLPVPVTRALWERIEPAELLTSRAARFVSEYGLDPGVVHQVAFSEQLPLFERSVAVGVPAGIAARALISTWKEVSREGVDLGVVSDDQVVAVLRAVSAGKTAKEAIPDLFRSLAAGATVEEALSRISPPMSENRLEEVVDRIIRERGDYVREKGMAALGPLMGVVMAEVRGSVDGKQVSQVLKRKISEHLGKEGGRN